MSKKYLIVKLCEGKRVLDYRTMKPLSANVAVKVPANSFWLRRIADGTISEIKESENK